MSTRSFGIEVRAAALRALVERTREVVLLAAVTGCLTGLGVAGFERLTARGLFAGLLRAPVWVQVIGPVVGLVLAAASLRWLARGASPATADEYIKVLPQPDSRFDLSPVLGRLAASVATLGGGGAIGYEGPSIYLGAAVGAWLHPRLRSITRGIDVRVALVSGAAAGVAAIFKAPATGAVFALEVPYQDDLASLSLLPALVGAASGYTVFVALNGTEPLFPVGGRPPVNLPDLAAAALLGVSCGIGARVFALLIRLAKRLAGRVVAWRRVAVSGLVLGGLVAASRGAFGGAPLSLGAGYEAVGWALDPHRSLVAVALLATIRAGATFATMAGGGAGGLFVPLVVQGALTGRLIGGVVGGPGSLFVVLGIAAFLGAGYRVPLAAVMFVAETTGRPGFVVPGLLAAVVAQLVMGKDSVSPYQQRRRVGHVEERARLPISSVLDADAVRAHPSETVARFFDEHVVLGRRRAVPVVDGDRYVGLVVLDDVLGVGPDAWNDTTLATVMRTDAPTGRPDWSLGQALSVMHATGMDELPVVNSDGALGGVLTTQAILDLEELLDRLEQEGDEHA